MIETKNLTKYYGKTKGIENINLKVEEGELFGFIGPNGAGKSTTIRTLLTLIQPTSGEALLFGKDVFTHREEVLREVGYLPSEVFYYDHMKVRDFLLYSATFYKKDCTQRIEALAKRLELDLNKKIDTLSYGNKKKVGIIQGLLHSPRLIILDEPTGGLDPLMQQVFFEMIKEENEKGATVLFSSHILSEVQKMCHKVAIIKDGSIVDTKTIADFKGQFYKKISLKGSTITDASMLEMPGISKVTRLEDSVSFVYNGDMNRLLQLLSTISITDIVIEEPNLEEIFLHYYERGEKR